MHPEGINWIWEQSPARFTRTDKHPPVCNLTSLLLAHTQTHTSSSCLYSSHALQKCLTPPARHTHTYATSVDQSVSLIPRTRARARKRTTTADCRPLLSWIQCFHGSHVFCTCRTRRSRLSGGERDQSYRFTGWLLINILQRHTYTASARAYSRTRAHGV